jgi:hypothetical protein
LQPNVALMRSGDMLPELRSWQAFALQGFSSCQPSIYKKFLAEFYFAFLLMLFRWHSDENNVLFVEPLWKRYFGFHVFLLDPNLQIL